MTEPEPKSEITRRTVPLEVRFYGPGALDRIPGGYEGGVVDPPPGTEVGFEVWREVPDEDGLLNPVIGEESVQGAFQISLEGTAAGFRELASYLLGLAELDLRGETEFHEHHEVTSVDGRTRLHIIVRRRS